MKYVYKDQPYQLTFDTNNAQGGASDTNIIYRKPDGEDGTLTGSASGNNVVADVSGAINDQVGVWSFHAISTFSGDTESTTGDLFTLRVKDYWEK